MICDVQGRRECFMTDKYELLAMAKVAKSILNDNTPYLRDKFLIRTLFTSSSDLPNSDLVILRLTVIDSFYGTNMSKRYYGVEDLGHALLSLGHDDQNCCRARYCARDIPARAARV